MTVEIGTEAAHFPKKEYINGISLQCTFAQGGGGVKSVSRGDCE